VIKNILTIDIEGWLQSSLDILGPEYSMLPRPIYPDNRVVDNTKRILTLLDKYNCKATCFVLGTVAEKFPNLITDINNAGHEIATHGYAHELVYTLNQNDFYADLKKSITLIEKITNVKVRGYRAPYGSITNDSNWVFNILVNNGIEYDSSIFPSRGKYGGMVYDNLFPHSLKLNNGNRLIELPISTINLLNKKVPLGGGYFRIFPYYFFRKGINRINNKKQPAVFYFHPYEIDSDETKLPLQNEGIKTRFVRYTQGFNRKQNENKLCSLLSDFHWVSIRDWLSKYSNNLLLGD